LYRLAAINVPITDSDEEDIEMQVGDDEDVATTVDELEERVENLETTVKLSDNLFTAPAEVTDNGPKAQMPDLLSLPGR
jgi:hypothetical protein